MHAGGRAFHSILSMYEYHDTVTGKNRDHIRPRWSCRQILLQLCMRHTGCSPCLSQQAWQIAQAGHVGAVCAHAQRRPPAARRRHPEHCKECRHGCWALFGTGTRPSPSKASACGHSSLHWHGSSGRVVASCYWAQKLDSLWQWHSISARM